jgi:hypothetical protein
MLIQTQADARIALQQLANDIVNTANTQVPQIGVADGGLFGWLGINNPGSAETRQAANDLLAQLGGYVQDMYASVDDSDVPLTVQQVAKMKLIQDQVADARDTVQSVISALDWSFGNLVVDSLAQARNLAAQAVQGGSKLLGLSWTQVRILGAVATGVVVYAVYRRVSGR